MAVISAEFSPEEANFFKKLDKEAEKVSNFYKARNKEAHSR
jgi:hypothetical protein